LILRPTASWPVCFGVRHSIGAHDQIVIVLFLTIFFFCLRVGCPLWREDASVVCSAVTLWSESRRTHNYILLCEFWDSSNLEGQVPVFISPGTGWHNYTFRHRVPFPSPLTTRRTTMEVF
jgi:hypothetical protein